MLCYMGQGDVKVTDGTKIAGLLRLRWENYLGVSRGAQCNHKDFSKYKREAGNVGGIWQLEKARKLILPCSLQKEHVVADTLILP